MNTLLVIGIVLLVLWALGFGVFQVAGSLIHLVLIIAIIVFVVWLLRGRGPRAPRV